MVEEPPGPSGPTTLDRVFFLGVMGHSSGLPPKRAPAPEEWEVDIGIKDRGLFGLPPKSRRITSVMRKQNLPPAP